MAVENIEDPNKKRGEGPNVVGGGGGQSPQAGTGNYIQNLNPQAGFAPNLDPQVRGGIESYGPYGTLPKGATWNWQNWMTQTQGRGGPLQRNPYAQGDREDFWQTPKWQDFLDPVTGMPISGVTPDEHIGPEAQMRAEEWARWRENQLFEKGRGAYGIALNNAIGTSEAYRPGGAAALAAGYYSQLGQGMMNSFSQQAMNVQAPDLMFRYREWQDQRRERQAENAQLTAQILGGITGILGGITGAGGGGGLPQGPTAPPSSNASYGAQQGAGGGALAAQSQPGIAGGAMQGASQGSVLGARSAGEGGAMSAPGAVQGGPVPGGGGGGMAAPGGGASGGAAAGASGGAGMAMGPGSSGGPPPSTRAAYMGDGATSPSQVSNAAMNMGMSDADLYVMWSQQQGGPTLGERMLEDLDLLDAMSQAASHELLLTY